MASTLYLETYVEGTVTLPTELHRLLATIKSLDERSLVLFERVRENSQAIMDMPVPTSRKMKDEQAVQIQALQDEIQAHEAMIMQFSEEKCELAIQAFHLLEAHSLELDRVLEQFESEMANNANQQYAPPAAEYNPFEYGARRGKFNDQWDTLEPLPAPTLKRNVTAQGLANKGRRERDAPGPSRTNTAAATAAVLADQDPYANGAALPNGSSTPLGGTPIGSEIAAPAAPAPVMAFSHDERTAGLKDSAEQPQLPGRLLTIADITPELAGRRAEMFWPADNMWYLVEIHRVNVADRSATIVYRTGEVEDLDLQDIAQEGHMSLISEM